jgi:hypothetical protein
MTSIAQADRLGNPKSNNEQITITLVSSDFI